MQSNLAIKLDDYRDFVEKFLKRYKSENTRKAYARAIHDFFGDEDISISDLKNVTVDDVEEYFIEMINEEYSASKVRQNIAALSALYDYLIAKYESKIINYNPFKNKVVKDQIKLSLPKADDLPYGKILTQEDINNIYKAINESNSSEYYKTRDKLVFRFMLATSLRRSEVANLKYSDFKQVGNDWFVVVNGKGRKQREVWVDPDIIENIKKFNPNAILGESDWIVFGLATGNAVNSIIKKWCKKVGITDVSAHQIRHTSLSYMVWGGAREWELLRHAGWSNIQTAQKYIHMIDGYEQAAGKKLKNVIKY